MPPVRLVPPPPPQRPFPLASLAKVAGILACDPFEEVSLGSQTYLSTVCPCPSQSPSPARMAFKIVAVNDPRLKVSSGPA